MSKVWRVKGLGPQGNSGQAPAELLFVEAYSAAHARMRAEQAGLHVEAVTAVDRSAVPEDRPVLSLEPSPGQLELLLRIASSPLIRSPFLTIALAVFAGALASSCLWSAIVQGFR